MMENKALKTHDEYKKALLRLEDIFEAPPNTPEGEEAKSLVLLIENFEDEHYPMDTPDPTESY